MRLNLRVKKRCTRCVVAVALLFLVAIIISQNPHNATLYEAVHLSLDHKPRDEKNTCEIVTPVFANRTTTALASYPGSGNTMTRILIEALTGVWTGSTHGSPRMIGKQNRTLGNPADDRLTESVVVVKTHEPDRRGIKWTDAKRVIHIIRDPLAAFPSACNAKTEVANGILMHSSQATEIRWNSCRDKTFSKDLTQYRNNLEYWNTTFEYPEKRLVVVYEDLVDDVSGPPIAEKIMTFLGKGIIPLEDVPCIWKKIVRGSAEKVHRPRTYTPKFRSKHLTELIDMYNGLLGTNETNGFETNGEPNLLRAISLYKNNALNRLKEGLEEGKELM